LRSIHLLNTKSRNRVVGMGEAFASMLASLPRRSEYVFTHEDGRPVCTSWAEKEMDNACEMVGLVGFTPHDLRDVFATDFFNQTKDIRKLQKALGHASIATTERYLSTLGLDDRAEAEAISQAIFGRKIGRIENSDTMSEVVSASNNVYSTSNT